MYLQMQIFTEVSKEDLQSSFKEGGLQWFLSSRGVSTVYKSDLEL